MRSVLLLLLIVLFSGPAAIPQSRALNRDFSEQFEGLNGAFVLFNRQDSTEIRYHPDLCAARFSPASTFKILNSLIGLETGVIPDKDYVIPWDSVNRSFPDWNRDHTLQTAIQYSVVWYYQELARRVGQAKMKVYVNKAGYGNMDISGGIDRFWLGSSLTISPDEQVEFLRKLYDNRLPFSLRSMNIVREILPSEKSGTSVLHAKTGLTRENADSNGRWIGWYVGYVERGKEVCFFATLLLSDDSSPDQVSEKRKEVTKAILRELKLY